VRGLMTGSIAEPVIASMWGAALVGGVELALACDWGAARIIETPG